MRTTGRTLRGIFWVESIANQLTTDQRNAIAGTTVRGRRSYRLQRSWLVKSRGCVRNTPTSQHRRKGTIIHDYGRNVLTSKLIGVLGHPVKRLVVIAHLDTSRTPASTVAPIHR